jgi:hypothetical protein
VLVLILCLEEIEALKILPFAVTSQNTLVKKLSTSPDPCESITKLPLKRISVNRLAATLFETLVADRNRLINEVRDEFVTEAIELIGPTRLIRAVNTGLLDVNACIAPNIWMFVCTVVAVATLREPRLPANVMKAARSQTPSFASANKSPSRTMSVVRSEL